MASRTAAATTELEALPFSGSNTGLLCLDRESASSWLAHDCLKPELGGSTLILGFASFLVPTATVEGSILVSAVVVTDATPCSTFIVGLAWLSAPIADIMLALRSKLLRNVAVTTAFPVLRLEVALGNVVVGTVAVTVAMPNREGAMLGLVMSVLLQGRKSEPVLKPPDMSAAGL